MPRTVGQAIAHAHAESIRPTAPPPRLWQGLCQMFVRTCWDLPARFGSAAAAWGGADFRHTTGTPPAGAPVFWLGGSEGFGHIALSTGGGNCWSTDILRRGYPDHVAIALIDRAWGNLQRVGWTEDLNEIRVIVAGQGEGEEHEPIPPPDPDPEDEDMQYIVTYQGIWLVRGDLSSRTGFSSMTDLNAVVNAGKAAGQKYATVALSAGQMARIPIAGATKVDLSDEDLAQAAELNAAALAEALGDGE